MMNHTMEVAESRCPGQGSAFFIRIGSHVPWRIMRWFLKYWPSAFQLLRYGTTNINNRDHWDEAWSRHGKDNFRATAEIQDLRRRVLEGVPRGARVLDVGCGVGEIMTLLRDQKGCDCSGLDIAPSAVSAVLARGMQAKVATLPSIPYESNSFEAVVSTEVLEHVTDARATLREIQRILKPGGVLLLSVPDGDQDEETSHVHRFNREKLEKLLGKYFTVDDIVVIQSESPSLFAIARHA
jgi:2-polyprenyl-3-methyl-5-hydroxy-6-metoxy-1,4-benzoquinol methylase